MGEERELRKEAERELRKEAERGFSLIIGKPHTNFASNSQESSIVTLHADLKCSVAVHCFFVYLFFV